MVCSFLLLYFEQINYGRNSRRLVTRSCLIQPQGANYWWSIAPAVERASSYAWRRSRLLAYCLLLFCSSLSYSESTLMYQEGCAEIWCRIMLSHGWYTSSDDLHYKIIPKMDATPVKGFNFTCFTLCTYVEAVVRSTQRISMSNGEVSNGRIPKDEFYR